MSFNSSSTSRSRPKPCRAFQWATTLGASAVIAASLVPRAAAEEPHPLTRIAAADAIRLALSNNPDARLADQDVVAAKGAVTQAEVLPNPSISVGALGTEIQPAQVPIPNQFGLNWTVPIGGKRAAAIAAARAGVGAAEATRIGARRQLALTTETAFVNVLLDASLLEFAREDQATFKESVAINELRFKNGKIAYGELLKLRIQARQVDDTVREAEQALVNDRIELRRVVGEASLSPDFEVVGALDPPPLPSDLTVAAIVQQALQNRSDDRALRAELDAAKASLTLARRQPIPDIGVLAAYNRVPGTRGNYDLQLTASVPIFDRNQGNVAQAEAAYEKAKIAIEALHAQIRADAARALQAWKSAEQRLASYNDEFVKMAKESLEISHHSYDEGRGSLLDYLDAESSYRDVQRGYRAAQAEAVLAAANVKFVSGKELP